MTYTAFRDNQLQEVTIPESVEEIRFNSFRNNQLQELTIPVSVKEIGEGAFEENPLQRIVNKSKCKIEGFEGPCIIEKNQNGQWIKV